MRLLLLVLVVSLSQTVFAELEFVDVKVVGMAAGRTLDAKLKVERRSLFSRVKKAGQAGFSARAVGHTAWKKERSGLFIDLGLLPSARGALEGVMASDVPVPLVPGDYEPQEKQLTEFVNYVNLRNENGRPSYVFENPQESIKEYEQGTTVIQTFMTTLVPMERETVEGLQQADLVQLVQEMDSDHFHYNIPFDLVTATLERTHIGHALSPSKNYLLSVFDFREYECEAMRGEIEGFYGPQELDDGSKSLGMQNSSIYSLSYVEKESEEFLDQSVKYFGKNKRPFLAFAQRTLFTDHLLRGAANHFFFFEEAGQVRFVVISNVALSGTFFSGRYAIAGVPEILLNGWDSSVFTSTDDVPVEAEEDDGFGDLLGETDDEIASDNICQRGLALGMIKFSQNMFVKSIDKISKN